MKLVINRCFGGFGLSDAAVAALKEKGCGHERHTGDDERLCPALVATVEELGEAASDAMSRLEVVEVPDGITYRIDDYDGMERVIESGHEWP